jgi:hypothetical protein
MFKSVSVKILIFNIVMASVALAGYFMHATVAAAGWVKFLFYPIYGYIMLSFISAAVAIALGALEWERGKSTGRAGIYGNAIYIVLVFVGLYFVWIGRG